MKIIKTGTTRLVILTTNYAIKIPSLYSYKNFLNGILSNLQEIDFNTLNHPKLCPILFKLPLGLLIVMPKVKVGDNIDYQEFCNSDYDLLSHIIENKPDSFGILNGKVVAIDYGS